MILINDFKTEPEELRSAMVNATKRVIDSGWYVLGKELVSFEEQWAKTCGVKHAIGVGNGMDAIEIALRSLGITQGDEVITTTMTAFATVLAIYRAGATPVLADIDPATALLSPESVERCISNKTKAVLLVHLYGQVRNMSSWVDLCNKRSIYLIEDCAQAHLAKYQGKFAGSFGQAGAYSFYPTKNLGALGDAGMLLTNDKFVEEKSRCLRNYGQSKRYHHPELGLNSRLDEMQASILMERIKWLEGFTQRRKEIAHAYRVGINHPLINMLKEPETSDSHVYHLFVITCTEREAFMSHMKAQEIQTLIHYPIVIHQQEPCRTAKQDPQGLAYSEQHAAICVSLPCHPQMSDKEIETVINAANSF